MFCPKCSSLLVPKKINGKLMCQCGQYEIKKESKITEKVKKVREIEAVDEDYEVHPVVEQECPKCAHRQAYFWEIQTRASDEPATKFFKCKKCKHIWRDYL